MPPVSEGGVAGGVGVGATAVPPVEDEVGGVAVAGVVVVEVVLVVEVRVAGVVVEPDGGAVTAGTVFGTS